MRENLVKSMAMQVKAQIHVESKLWSTNSPLPSLSEMQGGKPKEEIQQLAFSHGYAKFRTPCETT